MICTSQSVAAHHCVTKSPPDACCLSVNDLACVPLGCLSHPPSPCSLQLHRRTLHALTKEVRCTTITSVHADPRHLSRPVLTGRHRVYREHKHHDVDVEAIYPTVTNYGTQKIEIETAMFATKIDRNRSFLEKSRSTQH